MSILLPSLVAGLATALGAALALLVPGQRAHGGLMSLAGGVMLTLALADLLPAAWALQGPAIACGGAVIGAATLLLAAVLPHSARTHPLLHVGRLTALAIALHDLPEGLALAAGLTSEPLGLALTIAIGLHNLPEGAATAAPLRAAGVSPWRILGLTVAIGLITPLGTLLGILWLSARPDTLGLLLSLAAGAMVAVGWQQVHHGRVLHNARNLAWFATGAAAAIWLALWLH